MKYFKNTDIIDYLYQNYTKIDGLWFVKVEEIYGFDKALEIDREVWKVVPKLQARFIKERLSKMLQENCNAGSQSAKNLFFEALKIKLSLDRFEFKITKSKDGINVKIYHCPWHEIMVKSKRHNLSAKIGSAICTTEYDVFAAEFYPEDVLKTQSEHAAVVDIKSKICSEDDCCTFKFLLQ